MTSPTSRARSCPARRTCTSPAPIRSTSIESIADENDPPAALGDRLERACRELAVAYRDHGQHGSSNATGRRCDDQRSSKAAAASASRFDARLARRWRTTSIVTVSVNRGGEGEQEGLGVIVLERLAADVTEQRRVRGPDHRGHRDPRREPRVWLTRDARRDGEHAPPAGDEAGGDEQQAAAQADLGVGPFEAGHALGFPGRPAPDRARSSGGRSGMPCCHRGTRRAHPATMTSSRLWLPRPAATPPMITVVSLGHDRHHGIEERDGEDDEQEPPVAGDVVQPIGEIGDDSRHENARHQGPRLAIDAGRSGAAEFSTGSGGARPANRGTSSPSRCRPVRPG